MLQIRFLLVLPICVLASSPAFAAAPEAHADLKNAQGETIGTADFTQVGKNVQIKVQVSKLSAGQHGIHIHENGQCKGPDFKSAGGHLNPAKKEHGLSNPAGPHAGDLANLEVAADGTAKAIFVSNRVTLTPGPDSLLKAGGTALVIHAKTDDMKSNPAGNAGDRVACGEITSMQLK